ncbi:MAG: phosphate ABC transporter permease subunit PstC [Mesorhizobium sp.]|uniref:phosphate ABC transporter permease subunit PstC n=1 Tax=Mesorhizobium sp. TaxID=1871066 RepID=UPI000FE5E3CF|nr:phosphate ABC transporter permease subunit PstC [Mesorhizobium sp.]RWH80503.1 MAG: phosphate ABC transporter permease subunit PstC [Mesorhizobium sp.]RWH83719.1 MAG: phosphate ABC transporter permease subunit PstC [Mesorhizobium sp.]RWH92085.1 MAG: phosphate ABC transporter permease subunit PstC [Mesorhizobium sp.]RWI00739.1 MAG: phosphate ABC transporter permease subunit PstC [Mesorhizobium sp.]RWI06614.1 MAG: phosphate ABC transporter permease subunit PstC [Mesorhizobium sp.]
MVGYLVVLLLLLAAAAYWIGRTRAIASVNGDVARLHSLPGQHGMFLALFAAGPALLAIVLWSLVTPGIESSIIADRFSSELSGMGVPQVEAFIRDARAMAFGGVVGFADPAKEAAAAAYKSIHTTSTWIIWAVALVLSASGFYWAYSRIAQAYRARHVVERVLRAFLIACSVVAILTTIGIVLSLIFESLRFFQQVPFYKFLFGTHWSPQSAFTGAGTEAGAVNQDIFGMVPLFAGTLLITFIAMLVAAPIGLMAAIYLSDYASKSVRAVAKPVLEILAGIPTVVYGFFAALTVAPYFRGIGESLGLNVASESALAAGVVMGIMIIPFVSSLSDDVINAVPQSLRDGSAGLGATKSETIRKVVLPAALPGIVSAMLLAVSRAIGETMIVVMAAGLAANLTANPLEAVTTVTVQIVTLLVGDQEFDSAKTLAAFALGLVLFCITLTLNIVALRVVQKYREQYD